MMEQQPLHVFKIHILLKIFKFKGWWDRLEVHTNHLVRRTGLFTKQERTIPLSKISDITLRQSFLGGIFGYGDLFIDTAGGPGMEVLTTGLGKARQAKDIIVDLIGKARE